jgi:hypothetical protein
VETGKINAFKRNEEEGVQQDKHFIRDRKGQAAEK